MRVVQGVGGALLLANSTAIITDAFPAEERGMAMGINIDRRHRRLVHRADPRRHPGRLGLAPRVLGERAVRHLRHGLGLPQAAASWARRKPAKHRLARATSPSPSAWSPCSPASPTASSPTAATRWAGRARGAGRAHRRHGRPRGVRLHREPGVADPMFHLELFKIRPFTTGNIAGLLAVDRPRRPAVHADHLAAGHLAAAARLQLRVDAAVGRHLHAPADGRLPRVGARSPAGSPTATAPAGSPPAACCSPRVTLRPADAAAGRTSPTGRSPS